MDDLIRMSVDKLNKKPIGKRPELDKDAEKARLDASIKEAARKLDKKPAHQGSNQRLISE